MGAIGRFPPSDLPRPGKPPAQEAKDCCAPCGVVRSRQRPYGGIHWPLLPVVLSFCVTLLRGVCPNARNIQIADAVVVFTFC